MLTLTWHPGAVVFPWPAGTGTRGPRPHTRQKAPPRPPRPRSGPRQRVSCDGSISCSRHCSHSPVSRNSPGSARPEFTCPIATRGDRAGSTALGHEQVRGRRLAAAGSRHHALRAPTPLGALRPAPHRESSCLVTASNGPIACHVLGSNRQHP